MAAFGLLQVFGHNLLDGLKPDHFGAGGWLWTIFHVKGGFDLGRIHIDLYYPLVPWIGVMSLGYLFGAVMQASPEVRDRRLLWLGLGSVTLFLTLRLSNFYGDPSPWTAQATFLQSTFAFLNVQKYPPSLAFLLVTLGPAFLALRALGEWTGGNSRLGTPLRCALITFGRVPLFYYLLHLPLIHALVLLASWITGRDTAWLFGAFSTPENSASAVPGRGFGLPAIYATWFVALILLYPACRWFAALKQRRRDAWLSYF